jgi:hypothetical protein
MSETYTATVLIGRNVMLKQLPKTNSISFGDLQRLKSEAAKNGF